MKKLILLIISGCLTCSLAAQKAPKWMDKSRKALLTVTTFDRDDRKIQSTNGFYVSENGEALSAYLPFKGAAKATVTDTEGNTYPVVSILGADDLYDVIRFKVAFSGKKTPFLPLASEPLSVGTPVFLLPYTTEKEIPFKQGQLAEVSKLKDTHSYYKLSFPLEEGQDNAPLLLANGQVFALAQPDASGKKESSYGVSASYVNALALTSSDAFNTVYTRIGIRKAWPAEIEQASVALFLLAGSQDAATYLESLNDFVATFPQAADGYLSRASHYAGKRTELASASGATPDSYLSLALADIQKAGQLSPNKGEPFYNQAKLIYNVQLSDTSVTDKNWTIDAALNAIQQALLSEDLPVYRELQAEILFYKKDFPAAFEAYTKVNETALASAGSYYMAAKSLENIPGAQISDIIALLDSSLAKMGNPLPKEAAPYVLERVEYKTQLALYKEAIEDYDLYYYLVDGRVSDTFYFYREQARFRAGDNEGALQDIQTAIEMNKQVPDYYAEEASIRVRMQQYDEALGSIEKALSLAPDFAACYRIRGVCLVRQEKKAEACEAFTKARELGDPIVARLIKEHCP